MTSGFARALLRTAIFFALLSSLAQGTDAQTVPVERTFRESKATIEKTLKQLEPAMSGRLPALEGFALVGDHPLTQYQRAFYQCTAKATATSSGGTIVRMSAKVTAWYADANASRSGYQLLNSNGRLESDLLDQLSERLASGSASQPAGPIVAPSSKPATEEAVLSAPLPGSGETSSPFSSTADRRRSGLGMPSAERSAAKPAQTEAKDAQTEVAGLEEALKNQVRPKNLVSIKKSGTPVVAAPSLNAKPLFLASEHDEFEMLDFNGDWVHVRISGLSRGWIWRTSLEMPEGISEVPLAATASAPAAADLFLISREETAQFPGDWAPLRGKNVKIISVQKLHENEQGSGPGAKLEFAKSELDKAYDQLVKSPDLAGLVFIFDAVDGGMIAATLPTIQQWKAGKLTDAALWHQCYFDPPETFTVSSGPAQR